MVDWFLQGMTLEQADRMIRGGFTVTLKNNVVVANPIEDEYVDWVLIRTQDGNPLLIKKSDTAIPDIDKKSTL